VHFIAFVLAGSLLAYNFSAYSKILRELKVKNVYCIRIPAEVNAEVMLLYNRQGDSKIFTGHESAM
jgi:hypothetical protein